MSPPRTKLQESSLTLRRTVRAHKLKRDGVGERNAHKTFENLRPFLKCGINMTTTRSSPNSRTQGFRCAHRSSPSTGGGRYADEKYEDEEDARAVSFGIYDEADGNDECGSIPEISLQRRKS
ncbi:hypothetical protein MMC13_002490 [Lambiella insularis]|nr:hypothetical protein [Lambiella insularis]